ncbi:MAG: VOC family protein [Deltaproteobacteria bacterium]|nr:VOC family protein [Deltaproteobacteria bacterium]
MAIQNSSVVRIDHGVVPTNDLGRSLVFFTEILGAQFNRLVNVNLRGLNREVPEMAFLTMANHRGFGIALQDQPMPALMRPLEGPVWGFEIDERGIDGVIAELKKREVGFAGPLEYAAPSPVQASVFVEDPFQCTYELSVRRDEKKSSAPGQGLLGLRRISHVRLEVTDLEAARLWYSDILGLVVTDQVPGERQVTLSVAATGQLFILHEVTSLTQRSHYSRGPHVDVKVPVGSYEVFISRLANIERYWGPAGDRIPWHEPDTQTTYFYDPFGNRLQVSQDRPHH